MFQSQCYENGDYVKGVVSCTYTHTHFELINEVNKLYWGILGWTLLVSREKVYRRSLLVI